MRDQQVTVAGAPGAPGAAAPAAGAPLAAASSATRRRYSGTDDTPVIPANLPKPYYSFDPNDAY